MVEVGFLGAIIGSEGININREREDERSAVLSNSKINQGYIEVFGISQLLLVIHQEFHIHS